VTLAPGVPPALKSCEWDPAESSKWTFEHLVPARDYVGAVSFTGGPAGIRRLHYGLRRSDA
jgi:hypothetical protein